MARPQGQGSTAASTANQPQGIFQKNSVNKIAAMRDDKVMGTLMSVMAIRPSQQPLQTCDRPPQQQAYKQRLEGVSSHYAEPYQSRTQYLQSPGYGNVQHSHMPDAYGYINRDGINTRPEQSYCGPSLMQQAMVPAQPFQPNGSLESPRTRPPLPQRSHTDEGCQRSNDRKYSTNMRPSAPQGQQVLYTNGESASILRSYAPERQHVPYTDGECSNNTKPRSGQIKQAKTRILASPVSPETISWDNPFPTFPTNRKKQPFHDTNGQRPATASSCKGHEFIRAQPVSTVGIRDQKVDLAKFTQSLPGPLPVIGDGRGHLTKEATGKPENTYEGSLDQPLPQKGHDIPFQPPSQVETRSAEYDRSHSLAVDRGLHNQDDQDQQPLQRLPQAVYGSYDDHLDSYYEPVNERIQPQSNQWTRLPQSTGDGDMPSFVARPDERLGHGSSIMVDQQLRLRPQQPALTSFLITNTDQHGRSNDQTLTAERVGYAKQSGSDPTYRDQRQTNSNEGFMFSVAAYTPPRPSLSGYAAKLQAHGGYIDVSSSNGPQRLPYRAYQHSSGYQRQLPPPQGSTQNQVNSLPGIQPGCHVDSRMPGSGQRKSPVVYSSKDSREGLTSPMADEGTSMSLLNERSQRSYHTPEHNGRLPSAPGRRPSNPDALPEHPSPTRAGVAPATSFIQPKPPPVRQYHDVASPGGQPSISQQAPPRKLTGNATSVPVTHEELQHLGRITKANPNDQKTQLLLAQKMVEAASVLADEGGRADAKTRNKNREKYLFDAHKLVKKLVSGGYSEGMFYLADCHGRGLLGLQADPKEAFSLYQSAAKLGHAPSAYRVAVCCEMGQEDGGGTRKDPLKAVQWYKRAATLGDSPAMYKMGMIQLKGLLGQPKNTREAVVWLKRAAERADEENPHSLHELGLLYESASGNDNIIRDESYSNQLFLQAAELGYKFSQYRLGSAYEYGQLGCPIDPRQSIAWYSKAAVQEEHQSELALSGWYLTGAEGVLQQSDTEAYLWARKAAVAGLAKAEYAMGYFTEVGIGATANMEDAKRWYWRASSQNFPKARERLEDLRKGGARMQKSRVSRSAVNKQSENECRVM
ncbi:hypothetical protein MMC26_004559 [Xylographa opegraphella]|nr:hypothetical protein [Xylographa opegraphella]